ncbi:hypothetical protein PTKIN_Ptkin09bG0220500 [Pterospermum kingtungense]
MAISNFSKIVFLALVCMSSINGCSSTNDNTTPPPKFAAILIFGDSTVDAGNNNYIRTFFKGNNAPYGENYPGHIPTGRFSDGKLVPDFLASSLGIKEAVPPFLDPNLSDDELRTGVNFASAGSGFDDLTTLLSGGNAGTNDFVFNFFDIPSRLLQFGNSGYQSFLLQRIEEFVEELYDLGCRKIIVAGLPPIGCLPIQMTLRLENSNHFTCLEDQNSVARSYNSKLRRLLRDIQVKLPKSKIEYADIYKSFMNMINNPQQYGLVETKRGCCGTGRLVTSFMCNSWTPICSNPSEFLFWDSIHPTQEADRVITEQLQKEVIPKLF